MSPYVGLSAAEPNKRDPNKELQNLERPKSHLPIPYTAKRVFEGKRYDVYQWEQELPNGKTVTFEKVKRPDKVVVFGAFEQDKTVLFLDYSDNDTYISGGAAMHLKDGEDVLSGARRALQEIMGFEAKWFSLFSAEHASRDIDSVTYIVIAHELTGIELPRYSTRKDTDICILPFGRFLEFAIASEFRDDIMTRAVHAAKSDKNKMESLFKTFFSREHF